MCCNSIASVSTSSSSLYFGSGTTPPHSGDQSKKPANCGSTLLLDGRELQAHIRVLLKHMHTTTVAWVTLDATST